MFWIPRSLHPKHLEVVDPFSQFCALHDRQLFRSILADAGIIVIHRNRQHLIYMYIRCGLRQLGYWTLYSVLCYFVTAISCPASSACAVGRCARCQAINIDYNMAALAMPFSTVDDYVLCAALNTVSL